MHLFALAAVAAPLVPTWTVGDHRVVKIDLFSFAYGLHPYGSDWIPTRLDQWTVVVDCETVAQRVERCTFPVKPWWSYVPEASETLTLTELPVPNAFELVWNKAGRLSSFDPDADAGPFADAAADLQLKASFHRKDVVWKPDAKREISSGLWTTLVRDLASALELEVPKVGSEAAWTPPVAPMATRRYVQGVANASLLATPGPPVDGLVPVALAGSVAESPPSTGVGLAGVDTRVHAELRVDPATARVRAARWDLTATSTSQQLVGHTRRLILVAPWKPGEDAKPAAMPEPYAFP